MPKPGSLSRMPYRSRPSSPCWKAARLAASLSIRACAAVSAQGSVKATAGAVNVPVVLGGQLIAPGDVVVADDDGVMVVPRGDVPRALTASRARLDKEAASRAAFQQGELGLDRYGLRDRLPEFGIEYVPYQEWVEQP